MSFSKQGRKGCFLFVSVNLGPQFILLRFCIGFQTSRNGLEVAKAGQIADRYNGQQAWWLIGIVMIANWHKG